MSIPVASGVSDRCGIPVLVILYAKGRGLYAKSTLKPMYVAKDVFNMDGGC